MSDLEKMEVAETETAEAVSEEAKTAVEVSAVEETVEEKEPEIIETMEDYAAELESSLRKIYPGDVMEGEVIAFNENGVILDLNYYATGRVPVDEMSADPGFNIMTDIHIGDRFQAIVKTVDDGHGNILLSKKAAESEYSWDKLKKMMEEETVVAGTITEVVNAGAIMYVEGIRGFIPASKLDVKYVEDTAPYLGKKMNVRITAVDEEKEKLVLSAKELRTEEFMVERAEKVSKFSVGNILKGKVDLLKDYGAFIDLGDGISGLVHVSEISEKRINHPKAALKVGMEVEVMITKIENGKISLSMKAVKAAEEEKMEEEVHEYKSEYVPNNPFADLFKNLKL